MAPLLRLAASLLAVILTVGSTGCAQVVLGVVLATSAGGGGGGGSGGPPPPSSPPPSSPPPSSPPPSSPPPSSPPPSSPPPSSPPAGQPAAAFATGPSSVVAGAAMSPAVEVTLRDGTGQVVSANALVSIALEANPGGASLSGTTSVNAVAGVARFSDLRLDKVGAGYTLRASAPGFAVATSGGFAVSAGPADRLAFVAAPGPALSRAALSPAVQVALRDAFDNPVSASGVTVTLALGANPGGATLTGGSAMTAAGGVATFSGVVIDRIGAGYTLVASSAGLTDATSPPFDVRHRLLYTAVPGTAVVNGLLSSVEVRVLDGTGTLVTGATGPVTVAIAPGAGPAGATLSGTLTKVPAGGIVTFIDLRLDRPGSYQLQVTGPLYRPQTTLSSFGVTWRLVFAQEPTDVASEAPIAPAVEVSIEDALGARDATNGSQVTLALAANPGGSTLGGTRTVTAAAGLARFADLTLERAAAGYSLAASGPGLVGATSGTFTVSHGAPHHLAFLVQPSDVTAGDSITPAVDVELLDRAGNRCTTSAGVQVTVALTTGPGTLSGTRTVTAAGGVARFSDLSIDVAATGDRLSATSGTLAGATSGTFTVRPAAAAALVFDVEPSTVVTRRSIRPTVRVRVEDRFGNFVPTAVNAVTLALEPNGAGANVAGLLTQDAVAGKASFPFLQLDRTASGLRLRATSPGLTDALSAAFAVDDTAPRLTSITIPSARVRGVVPITYVVEQNAPCEVDVEVRVDATTGTGAAYVRATQASHAFGSGTEGCEGVLAGPGARTHVFLWNSAADAPEGARSVALNVQVRFRGVTASGITLANVEVEGGTSPGTAARLDFPGGGPTALAAGDLDRDGADEVAVALPGLQRVRILRGVRGGAPVLGPEVVTAGTPRAVLLADFDRDGDGDLVVASESSSSLELFRGDGALGLAPPVAQFIATPRSLAAVDLDRDGDLDLVVGLAAAGVVSLRNDGAGVFAAGALHGATPAAELAFADLDRDGDPDLLALEPTLGIVQVFRNDGAGDLGAGAVAFHTVGAGATALAAGDVDRDGKPDVLVLLPAGVAVLRGDGAGGLAAPATTAVAGGPQGLVVEDMDADGDLDALTTSPSFHGLLLLRGDGAGALRYTIAGWPTGGPLGGLRGRLLRADVDGDGRLDTVVASAANDAVATLREEMPARHDAGFDGPAVHAIQGAQGLLPHDVDRDGRPDLILCTLRKTHVLLGTGGGRYAGATDLTPPGGVVQGAGVGDLDGDDAPDLALTDLDGGTVRLYRGDGRGGFTLAGSLTGNASPSASGGNRRAIVVDLDGDVAPDVLVAGNHPELDLFFNRGGLRFTAPVSVALGASSTASIAAGDLDRDGRPDLLFVRAVGTHPAAELVVVRNAGGRTFAAPVAYSIQGRPEAFLVVDVDADGDHDVVLPGETDVVVLPNDGGGTLGAAVTTAGRYRAFAAMHLDGDGHLDLAAGRQEDEKVALLLGDGTGRFTELDRRLLGAGSHLAASDLNADGRTDLLFGDVEALYGLPGRAVGGLALGGALAPGAAPVDAAAGDWDRDGLLDLATVRETAGQLTTLRGTGGGAFGAAASQGVGTTPRNLVPIDLDRDGDLDLLVLDPSAKAIHSALSDGAGGFTVGSTRTFTDAFWCVAAGDLDRDGRVDLVVADAGGPQLLILRGDGAGGFGAPTAVTLARVTADGLTLVDLDRDGWLDLVLQLDSPWLLPGDRSGGLSTPGRALPPTFSSGICRQFVAGDLQGDGWPDVIGWSDFALEVWLSTGAGGLRWSHRMNLQAGRGSLGLADLDRDGRLDLLCTARREWTGLYTRLADLRGKGDGTFESPRLHFGGDISATPFPLQPRSQCAADLDRDGRLDVIVPVPGEDALRVLRGR